MEISYVDYAASSKNKIKRVKAKAEFKYTSERKDGRTELFSLELSGGRILNYDQFKDLDGRVEGLGSDIEEYVAEHFKFLNWHINDGKFSNK